MNVDSEINCGWSSDENVYKDPVSILNTFRNKYYADGNSTENGIIANALNDILPRMIVPPCWFGDTLYRVVTRGTVYKPKIVKHKHNKSPEVAYIETQKSFVRKIVVTKNNFFDVYDNFGKTVFLTRGDAKRALKGERT